MAGKGLHRVGPELLHPFAKNVLVHAQVTSSLRCRYPTLPDQLDSLKLELSTEPSSLHGTLRLHETPNRGVHQTGSSSVLDRPARVDAVKRDAGANKGRPGNPEREVERFKSAVPGN